MDESTEQDMLVPEGFEQETAAHWEAAVHQHATEELIQDRGDSGPVQGRGHRARVPNWRYFNLDFVNSSASSGFLTLTQVDERLKQKNTAVQDDINFVNSLGWGQTVPELADICTIHIDKDLISKMKYKEDEQLGILNEMSPLVFASRANAEDTLRWNDALHGQNTEGFWKAIFSEIETLNKLNAWTVVPRASHMQVLPSTWAFKIKRFPIGLVQKLKARICVMGNRQTDIDYFKCFAPVVAWLTVRTMFYCL